MKNPLLSQIQFGLWKKCGAVRSKAKQFINLVTMSVSVSAGKYRKFNSKQTDSSDGSSRISTHDMKQIVERLMLKQHRDSTAETYLSIWRQFNRFIIKLDKKPELWEDRAILFIGYLIDRGMQSSTVKSYISVIKKTLIMDGYKWNDNLVLIRS